MLSALMFSALLLSAADGRAATSDAAPDAPPAPPASPTDLPNGPVPYAAAPDATPAAPVAVYPQIVSDGPSGLSRADRDELAEGLAAARRGDGAGAQADMNRLADPVARKLLLWTIVDAEGEQLSFALLDQARRDLAGWPRPARRQCAAEKQIETSGLSPTQIVAWFQGGEPASAQGAMALAAAYEQLARRPEAQDLIRRWWRGKVFEADIQRTMLTRFADLLGQDDHVARADALLYGQQGPAARDMLPLLPADQQALAQARMALRNDSGDANGLVDALPSSLAGAPGLAAERARYLLKHNLDAFALSLIPALPANPPTDEAALRIWATRKLLINAAMRAQDYRAAYAAATNHGLQHGAELAEAEFYAGWIALAKLRDPVLADRHFALIETAGSSPITQGRAYYWRGRAAEARGDLTAAKAFYAQGARFQTAFYGQLAAERAGITTLALGHDPIPSAADRAHFEARDTVRAARMVAEVGQRDLFRAFVMNIADNPLSPEEVALLVDMARASGDQELAMRAVRTAGQHGAVLPERGYPMRAAPSGAEGVDQAMVLGITRQESGFDPRIRSNVGARGMMQLMPVTAKVLAHRRGERFSVAMLDDPDYNMRLGSSYIDILLDRFGGSLVMAAAAYNAGPGRPADWVSFCGDPRAPGLDPADFIECIPFSETRNYVMRVLEGAQVYRARLRGGAAPLTLAEDLKRGGYAYTHPNVIPLAPVIPTSSTTIASAVDDDDPIGKLLQQ